MSIIKQDYYPGFSRKRVFVPAVPNMALDATGANVILPIGDSVGDGAIDINSKHIMGMDLDANNEEVCINVRVPFDMDVNEDLYVWLIWAPETVSSGDNFDYVVTYAANKITDYAASASGTALSEATNALDTALNETVTLDGLTQYAPYRSMKGIISKGTFAQDGIMSFKIECDAAPGSGEVIQALGLELSYAERMIDVSE